MELSEKQPEEVLNEVETLEKQIQEDIDKWIVLTKEKLNLVFIRFCIKYTKAINYSKIKPKTLPDRPNYIEYYYRHNNGTMYFLMSSEAKIKENIIEILPNKELAFNDEI